MMNSKRILAMVLALVMVFSMLPMSAGAEEVPAFSITSATGKAGEEVTVAVTIENNPGVMMYNYGIQYDTTRLERVEMTKGGMDNVGIWTIQDKVLWENNDFTNSYYNGDTVVVKFKIKEDAPAGDAEISIYDFMALDYEGKLVEYTLKAGKITVEEKLETLIPFTKANHTDSGAAIHDKYTGVVGLKVEGIKLAGWSEWQQGFNYQNQGITIFVDAASKDDAATLSLILAEGQDGRGSIIETPATVQLTDGAGSFTADYMFIGTGGLAPKLTIPITFKLACAEHSFADATCNAPKTCTVCGMTEGEADSSAHQWNNATCTAPKTCSVCGATDGEADPDAHNYVDGVCEHCGEAEAAATYEVKIYGYPNDVYYVVTGKDENGSDILGDKLARTENEDGSITLTVPADVTRIAIYEEPYIYGFGVSPENNEVTIDYVEISIKTPDGGACTTADMTVTDSEGYNQPPFDYESDGMWSISAVIGREYTFTVTAPGYKTAVVKKTFDASENNYQSFDITLEEEAQEPEQPDFDGVTVAVSEMTKMGDWYYYTAIPAGKDLKITYPEVDQELEMVMNAADYSMLEYEANVPGEVILTAQTLQSIYMPEGNEYREFVEEMIELKETSEVVFFYIMGDDPDAPFSYSIIVEILADEPETPAAPGYTFATSADVSAENGDNVVVKVNITGHSDENVTTYNAYDVTLTYDNEKLEYVNFDGAVKSDNGQVEVDKENGTIRIVGCGADKDFGTEIAALTFKTKGEGEANVTISKVQVSDKDTAVDDNIPEASAKHDEDDTTADATPDVSVVVVPYTVTKPTFVSGNDKVLHGESYTFSYTDTTNYTYSGLTVTVGGTAVTPTEKDGVYTITNVTGPVEITATQTANSYDVTKPKSVSGPDKATYGTDYEFTVTPSANMLVDSVKVTLTGSEEEIAYTSADGKFIIAGSKIAGPITITVTEKPVAQNTTITFEGIATEEIQGGSLTVTVPVGETYTFQLLKTELYTYTAKVGETVLTESAETAGSYTIPGELVVANGITVQIEKNEIKKLAVDVNEYITLDGNAMFLVTAKWGDKVLAYGDETMIYSSKYTVTGQTQGAYCWLVLSNDELNTVDDVKAAAQAAIVEAAEGATATSVKYNYDINGTTKVDVNDAQLVYDMYNASYMEFTRNLPMLKFLEADMETDAELDTKDVAAIISYIVNGTAN